MGKKRNTRSQRTLNAPDIAVIVFCLVGALLSFWFFWKDLNRAIHQNQAPVGTVTFKKGGAQRRLGDRVLWDRLRRESPVYDGDFIRTSELSDATVTFDEVRKSGLEVRKFNLSENSLIQIRTMGNYAVVDLASGDLSVENSSPNAMVLISGGKQVELSGVMKARASEDGGFELEVLEGSAVISDGEDRIVREAGQVFSVDPEGRTVERPRVVMIRPLPDEELACQGETLRVDFSWVPVNFTGTEQIRLEISGSRRFIPPLERLDTQGSGASVDLPPGTYWWRAYAAGSGLPEGAPEKLVILPPAAAPLIPVIAALIPAAPPPQTPPPAPPPPRLPEPADRQPEDHARIGPAQIRQSRNLVFRWKEVPGANAYIFTLREAPGGNILVSELLAETFYTLDLRRLEGGNFIWQVEAVRQNLNAIEQRGIAAENRFTLDIPLPGNPQPRDTGPLYGTGAP
jgi:hypothetical protein